MAFVKSILFIWLAFLHMIFFTDVLQNYTTHCLESEMNRKWHTQKKGDPLLDHHGPPALQMELARFHFTK
jgi:hypothetical protein